jgi:hypothetical protein
MGYHCKYCGRKQCELLQSPPWKDTFYCPALHFYSNFRRAKGRAQGEHHSRPK